MGEDTEKDARIEPAAEAAPEAVPEAAPAEAPWFAELLKEDEAHRRAEQEKSVREASATFQKSAQQQQEGAQQSAGETAGRGGFWQNGRWVREDEAKSTGGAAAPAEGPQQEHHWQAEQAQQPFAPRQDGWRESGASQRENGGYAAQEGQPWQGGWQDSWQNQSQPYGGYMPRLNGCAVAALVLSIPAIFFNFLWIPSIGAIVFGIIALLQIKQDPQAYRGKGMAIAGLVIGIVFTIVYLIAFVGLMQLLQDPEFMNNLQRMQQAMQRMGTDG